MKKIIVAFVAFSLFVSGCKKNEDPPPNNIVSDFPAWDRNQNSGGDYLLALQKLTAGVGSSYYSQVATTLLPIIGNVQCEGAVLAPNGKIYGVPHNASVIHVLDPTGETERYYSFGQGSVGDATLKYIGGVLAPNGKIYCCPYYDTEGILVIDPAKESVYRFGSGNFQSPYKWAGAVLAPNGKIYCAPYGLNQILVIDPSRDTNYFIATTGKGYVGLQVTPQGIIYGSPFTPGGSGILRINTNDDTVSFLGSGDPSLTGTGLWSGLAQAPNGMIYGIPSGATSILKINPGTGIGTDSYSVFGTLSSNAAKWESGILCPDGRIYACMQNETSVLVIDPGNDAISTFGHVNGGNKYCGAVLAPNGIMYCFPLASGNFLKVLSPKLQANLDMNFVLSRFQNKY